MNEIQIVRQENVLGKEFKVFGDFDNPLFLAKDVAEWIEHSDVSMMLKSIDEDEKLTQTMFVSGQNRNLWFLTENGLYEVLMQSRKPIAKQFKKEVKKILHEIRTTGGYTVPKSYAEALQIAADQAKKIEEQSQMIEYQKPMVETYLEYVDRGKFCNFRDAAKYLGVKQTDLMAFLNGGYIYKNAIGEYRCYSEYAEYFALRPWTKGEQTRQQLMLTMRGLEYFGKRMGAKNDEVER